MFSTDFLSLLLVLLIKLPTCSVSLWDYNPKEGWLYSFFFFNPAGNRFDFSPDNRISLLLTKMNKICKSINILHFKAFIYGFSSETLKKQGVSYF